MVDSVVDSVVDSGLKVRGAGTIEWELNVQHLFRFAKISKLPAFFSGTTS